MKSGIISVRLRVGAAHRTKLAEQKWALSVYGTITTSTTTVSIFKLVYRQPVHKTFFIINQLGHKLEPFEGRAGRMGPFYCPLWAVGKSNKREPKVFGPIRISENSPRLD